MEAAFVQVPNNMMPSNGATHILGTTVAEFRALMEAHGWKVTNQHPGPGGMGDDTVFWLER